MNTRRFYTHYKAPVLLIFISLTIFSCNRTSTIDPTQKDSFIKYYGGGSVQKAGQVIQTSDGGYLVVGSSNSFKANGDFDQYVVKVDANGNIIWSKIFGDRGDDFARAVKLLPDGNYGIIGDRMIPGGGDKVFWSTMVNFLKINDQGVLINGPIGKLYGDTLDASFTLRPRGRSSGNDFALIENQNIVFVGNSTYTATINSNNFTDVYIGKFDLNGNLLEQSIFGNDQNDSIYSIVVNEPLFYMCGYTQDKLIDRVRVAAFSTGFSNGEAKGQFNYYTTANQTAPAPGTPSPETQTTKSVSILNDKSAFLLTGMRNNKPYIDKKKLLDGVDIAVFSNISLPFTSTQAQSNSILQASDGNYIITGYTVNADGNKDVFLAKINQSTGIVIWAKTFGGSSDDEGVDVKQTTDGGYIISANIGFGTNNNVIGLIKVKSDGTLK